MNIENDQHTEFAKRIGSRGQVLEQEKIRIVHAPLWSEIQVTINGKLHSFEIETERLERIYEAARKEDE